MSKITNAVRRYFKWRKENVVQDLKFGAVYGATIGGTFATGFLGAAASYAYTGMPMTAPAGYMTGVMGFGLLTNRWANKFFSNWAAEKATRQTKEMVDDYLRTEADASA